jgi:hypothetical protein
MAKIDNQRIMLWCKHDIGLHTTLLDAAQMAIILEKELCFFANYSNQKEKAELEKRVRVYANTVKADIPNLNISVLLLHGKLQNLVEELGEKYNTIMLCCTGKIHYSLLKAFYKSAFPFYFSKETSNNNEFKKIIIPIDYRNGTKESVLWGSYFGRFNQSDIILHTADHQSDSGLQYRVDEIIAFARKLYGQFNFNFWTDKGSSGSFGIHREAMKHSQTYNLLIFTGSYNVTLLDYLIGTFEQRIVKRRRSPVLLINPRREMYVLCD